MQTTAFDISTYSRTGKPPLFSLFREVRTATERLCEPLRREDYVVQSMADASPVKWHLAHTTWFFETFLLKPYFPNYQPVNPAYDFLFNSYYQSLGPRQPRAQRGLLSRPPVGEIFTYRWKVEESMQELLEHCTPEITEKVEALTMLGIQHEQQHQELILTDLKHLFASNPLYPAYHSRKMGPEVPVPAPALQWVGFPAGLFEIGHSSLGFAFDHESPRHAEFLESFELANRLVTNGEYLSFIEDGGYERPELWLSDGWDWVCAGKKEAPLYWQKQNEKWFFYTLSGLRSIESSEPVCHVNYYEADAYARWAEVRLPTEAEWEVASELLNPLEGNYVEEGYFHSRTAREKSSLPLLQMFGDAWEWTRSAFSPYPGYQPLKNALGEYNGKFMCNQIILRGGSCATPRSHMRRTYRNFFAPDKQWQFTGIRLAKDVL